VRGEKFFRKRLKEEKKKGWRKPGVTKKKGKEKRGTKQRVGRKACGARKKKGLGQGGCYTRHQPKKDWAQGREEGADTRGR